MLDISLKFAGMTDSQKIRMYIDSHAPVLDYESLFSDGTKQYRIPMEPEPFEKVTLRFRAGKDNVDKVYIIINNEEIRMKKESSDYYFDYYSIEYSLQDKIVEYYFCVRLGNQICYYNNRGVSKEVNEYYNFSIIPGYKTPDWAKGAVFYQIFVDRFYNGDPSNDVETNEYCYINEGTVKVEDWGKFPASMGVREFYGGDLKGIMDKLDYLQNLGIDVIYLNQIFVYTSNNK